jgi:cystathionine beta-lyase/cystathionine gamma-synthase
MKNNTRRVSCSPSAGIETRLCHAGLCCEQATGCISTPIYQTATFRHLGPGQSTGYDYSRTSNPTRSVLESAMADLEAGEAAFGFSSGMAAVAAVFSLFKAGDCIVASDDLYGGTYRYFEKFARPAGIQVFYIDTSSPAQLRAVFANNKVSALFLESPTNPMMKITDIRASAALARSKKALTIVDNTFMSPLLQQPLALGADIVIHSGTKFLAGHNDTLCGIAVAKTRELADRIGFIQNATGAVLSPFDSWLVLRGLKTLAVRMQRSQENACALARLLSGHKRVRQVYFPGLARHPGYALHKRQARGPGAIVSLRVENAKRATAVLRRVKLISFAESLGGVETLITHPARQTHTDVPEQTRQCLGVTDDLLRLSVGIENLEDLVADITQSLE